MTSWTQGPMHLRLRPWREVIPRARASSASQLQARTASLATAEPTTPPEKHQGDCGNDDGQRNRRRAPVRSGEAEHVRVDPDDDGARDVVAGIVGRPDSDRVVSVRQDEQLCGHGSDGLEGGTIYTDCIPADARGRVGSGPRNGHATMGENWRERFD